MAEGPDQTDPTEPATGREFLIATDLLLLLLDDDSGRAALGVRDKIDPALAGAVLAELAPAGAADIVDPDGVFRSAHVTVAIAETVTDPVLQDALAVIAEKDRSPKSLISKLRKGLRQRLLDRLADAGILEPTKDSFLIVFERNRWPAVDSTHEAEVRSRLEAVLLDGETPDARTGVLVALLNVIGQAPARPSPMWLVPSPRRATSIARRSSRSRPPSRPRRRWSSEEVHGRPAGRGRPTRFRSSPSTPTPVRTSR